MSDARICRAPGQAGRFRARPRKLTPSYCRGACGADGHRRSTSVKPTSPQPGRPPTHRRPRIFDAPGTRSKKRGVRSSLARPLGIASNTAPACIFPLPQGSERAKRATECWNNNTDIDAAERHCWRRRLPNGICPRSRRRALERAGDQETQHFDHHVPTHAQAPGQIFESNVDRVRSTLGRFRPKFGRTRAAKPRPTLVESEQMSADLGPISVELAHIGANPGQI